LAKAFVRVRADASKLPGDFKKAEGPVRAGASRLAGIIGGALAGAAGLSAFVSLSRESISLAERQIQAEARVAAVIKATGGAAGFTAEELKKMAASMQGSTTFGDEEILESMAILGTFKSVSGDVFKRTLQSAQDLSAAGFGPLKSVTQQLAKAIEDPARQMSLLRRSGVTLSKQQEENIKQLQESGNLLGAQDALLKAVEGQASGTAAALAKTPVGKLAQARNVLGDVKEELGNALLPLATAFANMQIKVVKAISSVVESLSNFNKATGGALVTALKWGAAMTGMVVAVAFTSAALKTKFVGSMLSAIVSMKTFVTTSVGVRAAIAAMGAAVKTALIGTGVGILVVGLGMAVVGIMKLVKAMLSMKSVQASLKEASAKLTAAWRVFKEAALIVVDALIKAIMSVVEVIAKSLGFEIDKLPQTLGEAVSFMVDKLSNFVLNAATWFNVMVKNWRTVWELMKMSAALSLLRIVDNVASAWLKIKRRIVTEFTFIKVFMKNVFKGLDEAADIAGKAANKAYHDSLMDLPFAEARRELKAEMEKLAADLGREFASTRAGALAPKTAAAATSVSPGEGKSDFRAGEKEIPKIIRLEAGRIGFAELGKKFQDAALKAADKDPSVAAIEKGNKIQDQILEQTKETNKILVNQPIPGLTL
jgi:DNA-directed RNA polymerase specialized sigma24 family protein